MTEAPSPPLYPHRHLLGIGDLSKPDIELLLERAEAAVAVSRQSEKKKSTLRGRTQINLFYEASTRTQSSFAIFRSFARPSGISTKNSGWSAAVGAMCLVQ